MPINDPHRFIEYGICSEDNESRLIGAEDDADKTTPNVASLLLYMCISPNIQELGRTGLMNIDELSSLVISLDLLQIKQVT